MCYSKRHGFENTFLLPEDEAYASESHQSHLSLSSGSLVATQPWETEDEQTVCLGNFLPMPTRPARSETSFYKAQTPLPLPETSSEYKTKTQSDPTHNQNIDQFCTVETQSYNQIKS